MNGIRAFGLIGRKTAPTDEATATASLRARVAALEADLSRDRAEVQDLRHKESLYRGLVELAPDAMLVHDDHRRIVYINTAGARLFGATGPDQIIGTLATSYVHPDARHAADCEIDRILNQNTTSVTIEQKRLRLDGSDYCADVSSAAIQWDGDPAALVVVRDVSDRIHARAKYEVAEARRREAHQRLLDAIESMNDGFALFDAEDRLQIYNRRYVEDVWGKDADFIRPGLTFREIADYGTAHGHWDKAAENVEAAIDQAMARHRNLPSVSDIQYATGRWMRQSKRRTGEGGVVAVYADITEIIEREAVLKASETRHRRLLEALPDAIVIDVEGIIVYVNDAALRLYHAESRDRLIGLDQMTLAPEELHDVFRQRRAALDADETVRLPPIEQVRRRLDGSTVEVESVLTRIDWEGQPANLGVMRDITERKRVERQARDTERRYSAVIEHIPGAVFQRILLPGGELEFTYISPGIKDIVGMTAKEVFSNPEMFAERIQPEFRKRYYAQLHESAENMTPLDIELPLRDLDGEPRWVRSSGRPRRRHRDGAVVWDGIITDITEQKRAEQRAQQAHQWLLHAIAVLPSGFMLWDQDDRLVLWNDRVKSYHPDPSAFREGSTFEELINAPHESVRKQFGEQEAARWIETRRSHHRRSAGVHELRTHGGLWLMMNERRTPDGFTVSLLTDVTERHESEEKLRESEDRYRALVNLLPDAVYVHRDGTIVLSNEAANTLFGAKSSEDLIGVTLMDLTHPEYHEVVRQRAALLCEPGTRTAFMRQKRVRLDGSWFWAEVAAAAIDWEDSRGGIVVMRDVTEQIDAEDLLVRSKETAELANRAKTEFLANISHELRTPLNAIIGFSDLMQREMFGPVGSPQYADYIRDIYQSGSHLHDVINDILDLSKIEAGKLDLREEIVDLAAVIDRCLRVVAPRADDDGLVLKEDIDAALPHVRGDERKLKQILINLLSNAVKFTDAGGEISVTASSAPNGGVTIVIADTGIGMAPEEIPRALLPFGQIDSSLARRHEGTGLGLPLTNSLIQLHGGRMEIDSLPGKGTTITIWLPHWRVVAQSSAAE